MFNNGKNYPLFIHYAKCIRNFRFYKGIYHIYPVKRIIIIISFSITFSFLVGFYSKDKITIKITIESFFFLII